MHREPTTKFRCVKGTILGFLVVPEVWSTKAMSFDTPSIQCDYDRRVTLPRRPDAEGLRRRRLHLKTAPLVFGQRRRRRDAALKVPQQGEQQSEYGTELQNL